MNRLNDSKLEFTCNQESLANHLFDSLKKNQTKLFRTPLKTSQEVNSYPSDNRWIVIVNTEIDIELLTNVG